MPESLTLILTEPIPKEELYEPLTLANVPDGVWLYRQVETGSVYVDFIRGNETHFLYHRDGNFKCGEKRTQPADHTRYAIVARLDGPMPERQKRTFTKWSEVPDRWVFERHDGFYYRIHNVVCRLHDHGNVTVNAMGLEFTGFTLTDSRVVSGKEEA